MADDPSVKASSLAGKLVQIQAKLDANLQAIAAQGEAARAALQENGAAQQAAIAAKAAAQMQAQAAKSADMQNAAMARIVQSQAKGAQDRARIAAQGEQAIVQVETAGEQKRMAQAQASSLKLVEIEAKKNAQLQVIAAKGAASTKKGAEESASGMAKFGEAAQQSVASATDAGGAIGKLQGFLSKLGPYGQAAAAAIGVVTIAVTALVGVIAGGMATAIGVVEKMTQRLAVFSALGGSAAAGKATLAMVQNLSDKLPYSVDQLSQWAQAMQRAGMSGKGLESATKAIAAAAAINPEGGAAAAENVIAKLAAGEQEAQKFVQTIQKGGPKAQKQLREMGVNLSDIGTQAQRAKMTAAQMSEAIQRALVKRGAGPMEAMMNTWPVILDKAKAGFMSLFSGLDKPVGGFMGAVKDLFATFGRGSPTMAAIRPVVQSVFGTLLSWGQRAVTAVMNGFKQLVIIGLKVRIGINPIWVVLRQLGGELAKAAAATGLFTGKSGVMSAILSVVGTVIKQAFFAAVTIITGFLRVLTFVVSGATAVITKLRAIFTKLNLPSLAGAAANMISSFISGIKSKIGSVVSAMTGMGAAAKKGLLGALGIASPSRVALEAAGNVTSTFSDKVEDDTSTTQKAFAGMVKVPPPGRSGGATKGGAGSRLEALLERLCNELAASPGVRDMIQLALAEAAQEGPLA
jgi:hypothetical protein